MEPTGSSESSLLRVLLGNEVEKAVDLELGLSPNTNSAMNSGMLLQAAHLICVGFTLLMFKMKGIAALGKYEEAGNSNGEDKHYLGNSGPLSLNIKVFCVFLNSVHPQTFNKYLFYVRHLRHWDKLEKLDLYPWRTSILLWKQSD